MVCQVYVFSISLRKTAAHVLVVGMTCGLVPVFLLPLVCKQPVQVGRALSHIAGEHHRKQRKMLNPVFSIAHMRRMTPLFYEMVHRV